MRRLCGSRGSAEPILAPAGGTNAGLEAQDKVRGRGCGGGVGEEVKGAISVICRNKLGSCDRGLSFLSARVVECPLTADGKGENGTLSLQGTAFPTLFTRLHSLWRRDCQITRLLSTPSPPLEGLFGK